MLPKKPPVSEASLDNGASRSPENDDSNKSDTDSSPKSSQKESPSVEKSQDPPLPAEEPPPLPNEEPPAKDEDDGWEPIWDDRAQAFYFFNRFTKISQWENPRVPDTTQHEASAVTDSGPPGAEGIMSTKKSVAGGYDPAIHGDYDPTADYAKAYEATPEDGASAAGAPTDSTATYAATGHFNRFTGRWQNADINPENFSDESKSKRQMNAFFDVDAAANSHDGRSLKAERSSKKISKQELKAFKEKRRERKEEKRRAWLRD